MKSQPIPRPQIRRGQPLIALAVSLMTVTSPVVADDSAYDRYREALAAIPALPPIPADNSITDDRVALAAR